MNMHFRIEPVDRVTLFGRKFRVKSQDGAGYVLSELDRPGQTDRLTFEEFADLLNSPDLRIERGYFTETARKIENIHGSTSVLAWVSEEERKKVIWRKCCCVALQEYYHANEVFLTEQSIKENRTKLRTRTEEHFGREYIENQTTAPKEIAMPKFYCPSSLLSWYRKFRAANHSIEGLVSEDYKSGNRSWRDVGDVEKLASIAVEHYANTQKPHLTEAINEARRSERRENQSRLANGQNALKIASQSTLYRRLKALGPYFLSAKRDGIDAANREFAFVERGVEVQLPLERVEVDENKLDIISLFTVTGLINLLPRERWDEIKKSRRWLYLFIDCATRCILSLSALRPGICMGDHSPLSLTMERHLLRKPFMPLASPLGAALNILL